MVRFLTVFVLLSAAGCASRPQESHTAANSETLRNLPAFCEVVKQMTWAARDSVETQDEIRSHNANLKKYCRPEGTPNGH